MLLRRATAGHGGRLVTGRCPNCETALELPVSGAFHCESCNARFEVYLTPQAPSAGSLTASPPLPAAGFPAPSPLTGPLATPAIPIQMPVGPAVDGPCATHPENPATTYCERCGDFVCGLCLTPSEGRRYCPRCFDLLYDRGAMGFTHRRFQKAKMALWLGILSVPGFCVYCVPGLVMSIAGIYVGVLALKEIEASPELPDRQYAMAGIIISAAMLIVTVVGVAIFLYLLSGV